MTGDRIKVRLGDCRRVLPTLADASVDAVVTDPPYELTFMGKRWDATGVAFDPATWLEVRRVMKPGGHLLAFGGTRTWHRLACAVEDAGFEVRDSIAWLYGSGFPKSLDVSKAIDKAAGAEREIVGEGTTFGSGSLRNRSRVEQGYRPTELNPEGGSATITAPATPAAARWQGWGTALKPAFEPIVVARKPLSPSTVAANVLTHGTGALNIDGCRIEGEPWKAHDATGLGSVKFFTEGDTPVVHKEPHTAGRWPANVVLDESQADALDQMSGETGGGVARTAKRERNKGWCNSSPGEGVEALDNYGDTGGASRFFYTAKAPTKERPRINGVAHPTTKPLDLMRWLVRLVTPPDGTVLDPFAGSGTTAEACLLENLRCIAIEREPDYIPQILHRLDRRLDPVVAIRDQGGDQGLFDLLEED